MIYEVWLKCFGIICWSDKACDAESSPLFCPGNTKQDRSNQTRSLGRNNLVVATAWLVLCRQQEISGYKKYSVWFSGSNPDEENQWCILMSTMGCKAACRKVSLFALRLKVRKVKEPTSPTWCCPHSSQHSGLFDDIWDWIWLLCGRGGRESCLLILMMVGRGTRGRGGTGSPPHLASDNIPLAGWGVSNIHRLEINKH